MKYHFVTVPAAAPEEAQETLNRFCASHRVVSVEKQFVHDAERSYWALCLGYLDGKNGPISPRKSKIDYREVLNEQEFALFAKLRSLRKTLAEQEGVPAYALFTNEQLASMVQQRVTSKAALAALANYYLDGLDRYLLEHLSACAQVRYMDDVIWWCDSHARARDTLHQVRAYVATERLLTVKADVQINRSTHGVRFCGYRVTPGQLRLSQRRQRHYRQLRQAWERAYADGRIDAPTLQRAYAAVHAMTLPADSTRWRQQHLQRYPALDV